MSKIYRIANEEYSGIEFLRSLVSYFDSQNESSNERFTIEQLVQLHKMALATDWDIYVDQWSARQIKEALQNIPPAWDDNQEPVYTRVTIDEFGRRSRDYPREAAWPRTRAKARLGVWVSRYALHPLTRFKYQTVFHGTSEAAWKAIRRDGLCAPVAENASKWGSYGWREVWRHEIYASYKNLSPEQRRRFHSLAGHPPGKLMSMTDLGRSVSLWWVSLRDRIAHTYDVVTQVDLSVLDYYWWLPDTILEEDSYVFVLPTNCPQAPPSVLKRWGYSSLRNWVDGLPQSTPFTDLPLRPDERHFYDQAQGAYSECGGPIGRFPWPDRARLIDKEDEYKVWAVKGKISPDKTWTWHDDNFPFRTLDDLSTFRPMSKLSRKRR